MYPYSCTLTGYHGKGWVIQPCWFVPTMGTPNRRGICSHIDCSPLWDPRESKGCVAILISPHHGNPEKAKVAPLY